MSVLFPFSQIDNRFRLLRQLAMAVDQRRIRFILESVSQEVEIDTHYDHSTAFWRELQQQTWATLHGVWLSAEHERQLTRLLSSGEPRPTLFVGFEGNTYYVRAELLRLLPQVSLPRPGAGAWWDVLLMVSNHRPDSLFHGRPPVHPTRQPAPRPGGLSQAGGWEPVINIFGPGT